MIPVPSGVRVWLAVGRTDMRKGMNGLALQVQQALGRDPYVGDLYVFRGKSGHLIKVLGMTASACRSMPSGWSGAASSGRRRQSLPRRRPGAWWRSARRSWPTCSTASTGATRFTPGGRRSPAEPITVT